MNVNVEAVHDMLDTQVRKGRNAVEAAGEGRWLAEVHQEQGILSRQARDETITVVNEWLATQLGVRPEKVDLYTFVAEFYALTCKAWQGGFNSTQETRSIPPRWDEPRERERGTTSASCGSRSGARRSIPPLPS